MKKNISEQITEQERWWILEHVTKTKKSELLAKGEIKLSPEQKKEMDKIINERVEKKKPLQYILGTVPFCDLTIAVEPPILIPRQETEEWCDWLIKELESKKESQIKILDIGCGSGAIALALANALPYSTVVGIDINPAAIHLSEKNREINSIKNAIFILSDLYGELGQHKGTFDLIVSNPPYISESEFEELSEEVTKWEDRRALVAHNDGFAIHKKILRDAHLYLKKGGQLLLECGKGQAGRLAEIFEKNNFEKIKVYKDLENVERWVVGIKF